MSISLLLEMAASSNPGRTAVVSGEIRLTTTELSELADGGAGVIAASGAQHAAYVGTGGVMLPLLLFSSARAGVAFTPLNYRLSQDGLRQLIDRLPTPLVIADAEYRDVVVGAGKQVITSDEFIAAARTTDPAAEFADPDDVGVVLFTSGTTSRPKAVELTHNNLTSYITGTVEFDSAEPGDAALICVPPYHIAGVSAALSNLYAGRKMVYLPQFDATEWVRLVRDEGVTSATVVPTMLDRIVAVLEAEPVELPALRNLAYGGSKVALPLVRKALGLLPDVGFVNAYGLTETSSTIAVLTPDDHREALAATDDTVARRLGSVGQPCRASRYRSAARPGQSSDPGRPGSCTSAASRCLAAIPTSVRCSTPTAGSPPKTLRCLTRAATCSSAAGPTTRSSAAARTSLPPRSRTCSSNILQCATVWSSAPKIPSGARSSSPSWCLPMAPPLTRTNCARMCERTCGDHARPTAWYSVTSCRPTRPARCCAVNW